VTPFQRRLPTVSCRAFWPGPVQGSPPAPGPGSLSRLDPFGIREIPAAIWQRRTRGCGPGSRRGSPRHIRHLCRVSRCCRPAVACPVCPGTWPQARPATRAPSAAPRAEPCGAGCQSTRPCLRTAGHRGRGPRGGAGHHLRRHQAELHARQPRSPVAGRLDVRPRCRVAAGPGAPSRRHRRSVPSDRGSRAWAGHCHLARCSPATLLPGSDTPLGTSSGSRCRGTVQIPPAHAASGGTGWMGPGTDGKAHELSRVALHRALRAIEAYRGRRVLDFAYDRGRPHR
jgi:hypothetical protein